MKLTFPATFGHQIKQVTISQPLGAGGIFHIMVDGFYLGQMWKRNGKWEVYFNERSGLTAEDGQALGERVEEEMSKE